MKNRSWESTAGLIIILLSIIIMFGWNNEANAFTTKDLMGATIIAYFLPVLMLFFSKDKTALVNNSDFLILIITPILIFSVLLPFANNVKKTSVLVTDINFTRTSMPKPFISKTLKGEELALVKHKNFFDIKIKVQTKPGSEDTVTSPSVISQRTALLVKKFYTKSPCYITLDIIQDEKKHIYKKTIDFDLLSYNLKCKNRGKKQ